MVPSLWMQDRHASQAKSRPKGRRGIFHSTSRRNRRLIGFTSIFILALGALTLRTFSLKSNLVDRRLQEETEGSKYPDDVFLSKPYSESNEKYFLIFHLAGIIYMFAGLSIVCDEYFVSALDEMVDRWGILEDVAGATFMAAGGSAPELFTAIMGTFVSENDVGFGTIVGSAVFNVLFVIGLCAVFAKETLELTWWPLFRDCSYYSVSLMVLVGVIYDGKVDWYEAIILFGLYFLYVGIMVKNLACRKMVENTGSYLKAALFGRQKSRNSIRPFEPSPVVEKVRDKEREVEVSRLKRRIQSFSLRIMIQQRLVRSVATEIQEASVRFEQLSASGKFTLTTACAIEGNDRISSLKDEEYNKMMHRADIIRRKSLQGNESLVVENIEDTDDTKSSVTIPETKKTTETPELLNQTVTLATPPVEERKEEEKRPSDENTKQLKMEPSDNEEDEDDNPFSWPEGPVSQIFFIATLPLVSILYITIPRCGEEAKKNFFMITFFMSLIWIAAFTYCMVWWATIMAEAFNVPSVVMGVTVLAAGTSIPDAISSVIVARRGFGDMAVSSSIGSNIFDILVGLPVPWIAKTCFVSWGTSVVIHSETLIISVTTLLSMVILVICSIIYTKWKLDKTLGSIMFVLYILFVIQTLILES